MATRIYLEQIKNTLELESKQNKAVVLEIAPTVGAIKGLAQASKYQGAYPTAPTERVDGTALELGDYYLNTTDGYVYYYEGSSVWESPEKNSKESEDNAATSEANAATSETNAANSASAALSSEQAAATSEANAASSESAAASSETNAANSASAALASEQAAAASEAAASVSEANAATSETNAAIHAANAEAAFDNFDDKYLGAKPSDPTTDNDGNPLQVGATYWNTTEDEQRFWNGAEWDVPSETAIQAANTAVAARDAALIAEAAAEASEQAAAASETNALASEIASAASEAAAATSEANAAASETAAANSASAAATSETNAAASEAAAANSASLALLGGEALSRVAQAVQMGIRRRQYTGSGFAEMGRGSSGVYRNINQGLSAYGDNQYWENAIGLGIGGAGTSRTEHPIAIIGGIEHEIMNVARTQGSEIRLPTAPDGSKTFNPETGAVHKFTSTAGVGTEYEAYTTDFDAFTYLEIDPYETKTDTTVEVSFILAESDGAFRYLFDTNTPTRTYIGVNNSGNLQFSTNIQNLRVNGEPTLTDTLAIVPGREYRVAADIVDEVTIDLLGCRYDTTGKFKGQIWDYWFRTPSSEVPDRNYKNLEYVPASDPVPDNAVSADANGYSSEDWGLDWDKTANNHVDITEVSAWEAHGDFDIEMLVKVDILPSGTEHIKLISDVLPQTQDAGTTISINPTTKRFWCTYLDESNPASTTVVEANKTYHIMYRRRGTTGEFLVNGEVELSGVDIGSKLVSSIGAGGYGHEMTGALWNVKLTDVTNPGNSRNYPMVLNSPTQPTTTEIEDSAFDKDTAPFYSPDLIGESAGVNIQPWIPTTDSWSVKFKTQVDSLEGNNQWFVQQVDGGTAKIIAYIGTGALSFRAIDGGNLNKAEDLRLVPGQVHEVELRCINGTAQFFLDGVASADTWSTPVFEGISSFGYQFGNNNLYGRFWNVEFTDSADDTNSRYYPVIEYDSSAPKTGTAVAQTHSVTASAFSAAADWTHGPLGVFTSDAAKVGGGVTNQFNFIEGQTYTLEYHIVSTLSVAEDVQLRNASIAAGASSPSITIGNGAGTFTGTWTFTAAAEGGSTGIYLRAVDSEIGDTLQIVSLVARSADGEIVGLSAGNEWVQAGTDSLTKATAKNFGGFPWNNTALSTDATVNGETTKVASLLEPSSKAFLEGDGFSVITNRKDFVMIESWTEDLEDLDIVCPYGNVQYYGSESEAGALGNNAPQSYSAFGEWDTSTHGLNVVWSTLTDSEKAAWAAQPKHKITFDRDTGKFYQERYRVRSIEGVQNDWVHVLPDESNDLRHQGGSSSSSAVVGARGASTSIKDLTSVGDPNKFTYTRSTSKAESERGRFVKHTSTDFPTYAVPLVLVQRMNQGVYHPVLNPYGTASPTVPDSLALINVTDKIDILLRATQYYTMSDLFKQGNVYDSDFIAGRYSDTGSFRSPSSYHGIREGEIKSHNGIYKQQITDLRLNANKQDHARLILEATSSAFSGNTRGFEGVTFTKVFPSVASVTSDYTVVDSSNASAVVAEKTIPGSFDKIPAVDIVGLPERIMATFPDGVAGKWNLNLPAAASRDIKLTRKLVQPFQRVFTSDDGNTWSRDSISYSGSANTVFVGAGENQVLLYYYDAITAFTQPDSSRNMLSEPGRVVYSARHLNDKGNRLCWSTIGKYATSTQHRADGRALLLDYSLNNLGALETNEDYKPQHTPLNLGVPDNDSIAFKALPKLVDVDGLLYVQWHATELQYVNTEFTPWGDNGDLVIGNGEDTVVDINGNTVKVVTHVELLPVGITDYTLVR